MAMLLRQSIPLWVLLAAGHVSALTANANAGANAKNQIDPAASAALLWPFAPGLLPTEDQDKALARLKSKSEFYDTNAWNKKLAEDPDAPKAVNYLGQQIAKPEEDEDPYSLTSKDYDKHGRFIITPAMKAKKKAEAKALAEQFERPAFVDEVERLRWLADEQVTEMEDEANSQLMRREESFRHRHRRPSTWLEKSNKVKYDHVHDSLTKQAAFIRQEDVNGWDPNAVEYGQKPTWEQLKPYLQKATGQSDEVVNRIEAHMESVKHMEKVTLDDIWKREKARRIAAHEPL